MATRAQDKRSTYIYHLPYRITQQICSNLDVDRAWSKLASEIGYTYQEVKKFDLVYQHPSGSPTEKLLSDWGCRNHTAIDLFNKLRCIQRNREAQILEAWFTSSEEAVNHSSRSMQVQGASSGTNLLQDLQNAALPKPVPPGKTPPSVDWGKEPIQNSSKYMDNVNLNGPDKFSQGSKVMPDKMVGGKSMTSLGKPLNHKVSLGEKGQMKSSLAKMAEKPDKGEKNGDMLSVKENIYSMTGGPAVAKGDKGNKSLDNEFINRLESVEGFSSMKDICNDVDEYVAMIGTPSFSYKEINQATNGFNEEKMLGTGQYGEVFFGRLKNTDCAVKKLFSRNENPNSQNLLPTELKILTKYRHENIVPLYGYTLEGSEIYLVYQYMPNGSLYDILHGKNRAKPFPWEQRLSIMRGAACGLQYLHTMNSKIPLVHSDMKCSNILLDKHMEAKISDLGMARHDTSGSTGVVTDITKQQTDTKQYQDKVYLPPECHRGSAMSVKGDAFSYGVVLLEICTGEKAYDEKREGVDSSNLVFYVKNHLEDSTSEYLEPDPRGGICQRDLYQQLFKIARRCTEIRKKDRPNIEEVYKEIEELETSWNECSLSSNGYSKSDASMSTNYSTNCSTDQSYVSTEQDQMVPSKLVIPVSGSNSFPAIPASMDSGSYQEFKDDVNLNVQSPEAINSNDYHNNFTAVKHKLQDIEIQASEKENPIWSSTEENESPDTGEMKYNESEICEGVQNLNVSEVVTNTELSVKQKRDLFFDDYDRQKQAIINSEQELDIADMAFGDYEDDFFTSELETMVPNETLELCESESVDSSSIHDIGAAGHVTGNHNVENPGMEKLASRTLSFHQQKLVEYQKITHESTENMGSSDPDTGCENCEKSENSTDSVNNSLVMHKHKYNAYQEIADCIDQHTPPLDGLVEQNFCDNSSGHCDSEYQGVDSSPNNSLNCVSADQLFGGRKISPSGHYWQQKRAEPSESDECFV